MRCVLAAVALSFLALGVAGAPATLRADAPATLRADAPATRAAPATPPGPARDGESADVTAVAVLPERRAAVVWLPEDRVYRLVEVGDRAGDYEVLAIAPTKVVLQRVPGGEILVVAVTPPTGGGSVRAARAAGPATAAAGPLDPYGSDHAASRRPAPTAGPAAPEPLDPYAPATTAAAPMDPYAAHAPDAPAPTTRPLDPYPTPAQPPVAAAATATTGPPVAATVGPTDRKPGPDHRTGAVAHGPSLPAPTDAQTPAVSAMPAPAGAPAPAPGPAPAPAAPASAGVATATTTAPPATKAPAPAAPAPAAPATVGEAPPGSDARSVGAAAASPAGPRTERATTEHATTEQATFDRRDLSAALADFDRLAREVQVESHPRGVIIAGLARGSFLHRVGLRKGDVITAVAGRSIASVDAAADVYARVLVADSFAIDVERAGAPLTIECQVRGSR